jgi:DNA-directed RNA polymerase specialized sigma subunit
METVTSLVDRYTSTTDPSTRFRLEEQILKAMDRKLVTVTRKYSSCADSDELHQLARIGLIRGLRRFSESAGVKFETYAYQYVNGFIKNQLRDTGSLIKHPAHFRDFQLKYNRVLSHTKSVLGRTPTNEEMAKAMGLSRLNYLTQLDRAKNSAISVEGFPTHPSDTQDEETEFGAVADIYGNPVYGSDNNSTSEHKELVNDLVNKYRAGYRLMDFRKEFKLSTVKAQELVSVLETLVA